MERNKRVFSVSKLNAFIKGVFDDEFMLQNLTVTGEIEEFKPVGRITYITLVENGCRLSCVSFVPLQNASLGVNVQLDGSVKFYQKTGKVSFVVTALRLFGEGDKKAAFLKLKDELEREGLFSRNRPLPKLIKSCCVITGETGIVIEDFKSVLKTNSAKTDVYILPIKIQGDGAEKEIEAAIDTVNRHDFCDCVVLMRGGGGAADLEAFNTAAAARAVYACKVPVVTAIGHEADNTLCDLCADFRAGTPSIAAQAIADNFNNAYCAVNSLSQSLASGVYRLYNKEYARVIDAARAAIYNASRKVELGSQKVIYLKSALDRSVETAVTDGEKKLASLAVRLNDLSPLKMLSKGFIRTEKDGKAVLLASGLSKGDEIKLYYADASADAVITGKGKKYGV